MKENGIQLGDMNKILMEKVEELTLYIIEQNKTIEFHQNQNIQQSERLDLLEKKINQLLKERG